MLPILKSSIAQFIVAVKEDRSAAGALEYALLTAFIAVAIIGAVTNFGTALAGFFTRLTTAVTGMAA